MSVSPSLHLPKRAFISTGHRHCNITGAKQSAECFCVCVQVCKDKNNLWDLDSKINKCWHSLSRYNICWLFILAPDMGLHSHIQSIFRVNESLSGSREFSALRNICQTFVFFCFACLDCFISHYIFSSSFLSRPSFTQWNKHSEAAKYNLASFKLVLCETWSLAELHGDIYLLRCQMLTLCC